MKFKNVILFSIITVFLIATQVLGAGYSDISNHWAKMQITRWRDYGIFTDSTGNKFRPDDPITRGEFAIWIDNLMKYRTKSASKFSDLGQSIYTDPILRANEAGIISGSNGKIRPRDKITREEAAVMICKSFEISASSSSLSFTDNRQISEWAKGYVSALVNKGYISGRQNKFEPKGNMTRAEAVTIIDNIVDSLANQAQTYSNETINGLMIVNTPNVTLKNLKINGNLIVTEGVGNGNLTLDNVKVTGNITVKGGGTDTIHITGSSNINKLTLCKAESELRVKALRGTNINLTTIANGSDDVILTGIFNNVEINSTDNKIALVDANVSNVIISSSASFAIDNDSTISNLNLDNSASNSKLNIEGTVTTASINSSGIEFIANTKSNIANLNIASKALNSKFDIRGKVIRLNNEAPNNLIQSKENSDIKNLKIGGSALNSDIEMNGLANTIEMQAEDSTLTVTETSRVDTIKIDAQYNKIYVQGNVSNVDFASPNSELSVEGKVNKVYVQSQAENTKIYAERYSEINTIISEASDTQISGVGKIINKNVEASETEKFTKSDNYFESETKSKASQTEANFETETEPETTKKIENIPQTQTNTTEKPISPSVSEATVNYSKASPSDVYLSLDFGTGKLKATEVVSVTLAGKKLDSDVDYSVSGNSLIIKSEVLDSLVSGNKAVIVTFNDIFATTGKLILNVE